MYGSPSHTQEQPHIKMTFQIKGNKWCGNVARQHKSNGIFIDVDLKKRQASQLCWDPECRGYRSPPIAFPVDMVLDEALLAQIREAFFDKLLMEALDANPALVP